MATLELARFKVEPDNIGRMLQSRDAKVEAMRARFAGLIEADLLVWMTQLGLMSGSGNRRNKPKLLPRVHQLCRRRGPCSLSSPRSRAWSTLKFSMRPKPDRGSAT